MARKLRIDEELRGNTLDATVMAWTVPEHTRSQVNDAGATLVAPSASPQDKSRARTIVHNWRASHSFPLNALQMNLRHAVAGFGDAALVAQRLKRMSSIEAKLRRSHHMQLARMHDIGGCRAVLPSADDVLAVVRQYDRSRALHEPLRRYDYLTSPRDSGYRGVHLVYGYRTKSDAHAAYSGMGIEIQLRSRPQHAWATAVETVGTFSGQALKSSEGNEAWLRFFALMATDLACTEGLPPVPGTPPDRGTLRGELVQLAAEINAVARLEAYGRTLRILEGDVRNGRAAYFHIYLDLAGQNVRWNEYSKDEREEAIQAYEEVETAIRRFPRAETVLVQVGSVEALRRAYPNYFADTSVFVAELKKAIKKHSR